MSLASFDVGREKAGGQRPGRDPQFDRLEPAHYLQRTRSIGIRGNAGCRSMTR